MSPDRFRHRVRLLHPAYQLDDEGGSEPVFWRDIAARRGVPLTRGTEFAELVGVPLQQFENGIDGSGGQGWNMPPEQGTLPEHFAALLADLLTRYTSSTEHCWFGFWDGWSDLPKLSGATAHLMDRDYLLMVGPLRALSDSISTQRFQSANLVWPQENTWLLSTDIDEHSSEMAGSPELVTALINHPHVETIPLE